MSANRSHDLRRITNPSFDNDSAIGRVRLPRQEQERAAVAAFLVAFVSSGGNSRTARRAGVKAFVSDLGFRARTWRPTGTAPTFPTGTGIPELHQIFQGTILSGLFPSPQSYLRWVNGFAGGSLAEQLKWTGRCPPTRAQIRASGIVAEAIKAAQADAAAFRNKNGFWVEHGGWILWKVGSRRRFVFVVKEPAIGSAHAPYTPRNRRLGYSLTHDEWLAIYLDALKLDKSGFDDGLLYIRKRPGLPLLEGSTLRFRITRCCPESRVTLTM